MNATSAPRSPTAAASLFSALSALTSRDARLRTAVIAAVAPSNHDVIFHVDCGDGALTTALAQAGPGAVVLGLDPDPAQIARARARARTAGVRVELAQAEATDIGGYRNELAPSKIVSSMDLAALGLAETRARLKAAREALRAQGGLILIAPASRQTADGPRRSLADLAREAGFVAVHVTQLSFGPALVTARAP